MGIPLQNVPYYNLGGGLDTTSSPTKTPEVKATYSLNMDYTRDGAIRSRKGSRQLNKGNQIAGAPKALGFFDFRKTDGTEREVSAFGDDLYVGYEAPVGQGFTLNATAFPDFEFFADANDDYLYYGNGIDDNLEYDATTWRLWSIVAPAAAPVVVDLGAGALQAGNYTYYYTFARYDVANQIVLKESPLSPVSNTLTIGANITIRIPLAVSADPQVNARIIYRISPTSVGKAYQHAVVADNVALFYDDNNPDDGTIFADFDNANAPLTDVFEEYGNRMFGVRADKRTDLFYSEPLKAWNVPVDNFEILDGEITTIKRFFGVLIIGTDRSLWVFQGDPESSNSVLKRISSKIGIMNNRCICGESILYFMGTNRKVYALRPTELTEDEIRIDNPLSDEIEDEFQKISLALKDQVAMEYYTDSDVAKVYVSYNIGAGPNQNMAVYNEGQSLRMETTVWGLWDNQEVSAIRQVFTDNAIRLISGDFNGFIWKLEDPLFDGDGAEINGFADSSTNNTLTDEGQVDVDSIATAGGAATLTDNTQVWVVNEWQTSQLYIHAGTGAGQTRIIQSNTPDTLTVTVPWGVVPDATSQYYIGGMIVNDHIGQRITIVSGTGEDQVRTIISNTPAVVTVSSNWSENPDATSEFTIGGYDSFYFSNWKFVLENYDVLKQLWYIWLNANANGDYNISMILQVDFDTSTWNQVETLVNLSALNSIWGDPGVVWGLFIWGSRSVFQDRFRLYARFRAIRIGFRNRLAGQPFQINGYSISCQNKNLFFGSAP